MDIISEEDVTFRIKAQNVKEAEDKFDLGSVWTQFIEAG
jgi:hypothetical protein